MLRLIVFDMDGTLVDSGDLIFQKMCQAFDRHGFDAPEKGEVYSNIGLSLELVIANLLPQADPDQVNLLAAEYRASFAAAHQSPTPAKSKLYDGVLDVLHSLARRDDVLLGIATGKSVRGVDRVLREHDLGGLFQTIQTADTNRSKPDPEMLMNCLRDTGAEAEHAVILGDTSFDMDMGHRAGYRTLAAGWGYHSRQELLATGCDALLDQISDLPGALEQIWDQT